MYGEGGTRGGLNAPKSNLTLLARLRWGGGDNAFPSWGVGERDCVRVFVAAFVCFRASVAGVGVRTQKGNLFVGSI